MTWKGPAKLLAPPKLTRSQVEAKRKTDKRSQWPYNTVCRCPDCEGEFYPEPGPFKSSLFTRGGEVSMATVLCPHCGVFPKRITMYREKNPLLGRLFFGWPKYRD